MFELRNISNSNRGSSIVIGAAQILIYVWIVYPGLCQIINLFGIVTNIINIVCFVKQGFTDSVNISLLGLAVSDLASLITVTLICSLVPCDVGSVDLPFESLDIAYMLSATPHMTFTRVSSCITALITFERCLCIAVPLKIKGLVTPKRTTMIIIAIFIIFIFSSSPIYFANRLGTFFSARKNRTTYGIVYRNPQGQLESISVLVNNFIVPFGAFILIGVCTIILAVQLRQKSKWRKTNVTSEQAGRVSSRNQNVAKMVVLLSVLYITCFVPASVMMLAFAFEPAFFINGKFIYLTICLYGIIYILEGINSSVNIFIYHHMSSKYRDAFKKLFILKYKQKDAQG